MPRDISLETTILDILGLTDPTPMQEKTLLRECEIRLDRMLTTAEGKESLRELRDRELITVEKGGLLGLEQVGLTDTCRKAKRGK